MNGKTKQCTIFMHIKLHFNINFPISGKIFTKGLIYNGCVHTKMDLQCVYARFYTETRFYKEIPGGKLRVCVHKLWLMCQAMHKNVEISEINNTCFASCQIMLLHNNWLHRLLPSIHSPIHYLYHLSVKGQGGRSHSQLTLSKRQGTPWACHQSSQGFHGDK